MGGTPFVIVLVGLVFPIVMILAAILFDIALLSWLAYRLWRTRGVPWLAHATHRWHWYPRLANR